MCGMKLNRLLTHTAEREREEQKGGAQRGSTKREWASMHSEEHWCCWWSRGQGRRLYAVPVGSSNCTREEHTSWRLHTNEDKGHRAARPWTGSIDAWLQRQQRQSGDGDMKVADATAVPVHLPWRPWWTLAAACLPGRQSLVTCEGAEGGYSRWPHFILACWKNPTSCARHGHACTSKLATDSTSPLSELSSACKVHGMKGSMLACAET